MKKTTNILFAGFGGQGILFAGKFVAYKGLLEGKHISWLPSYGPEMRGGTANCSVTISDDPIGSPIVDKPDVLIAMNAPSFDKYITEVKSGGMAIVDSSLIDKKSERDDVEAYYIPATRLASEEGLTGLANMIMIGYMIKKAGVMPYENVEKVMAKVVPAKKQDKLALNIKAVELGYSAINSSFYSRNQAIFYATEFLRPVFESEFWGHTCIEPCLYFRPFFRRLLYYFLQLYSKGRLNNIEFVLPVAESEFVSHITGKPAFELCPLLTRRSFCSIQLGAYCRTYHIKFSVPVSLRELRRHIRAPPTLYA